MTTLEVQAPYSFPQTLAFIASFPPCRDASIVAKDALTGAVSVEGRGYAYTLREQAGALELEIHGEVAAPIAAAIAEHARSKIGATDDVSPLYEAASGDAAFSALVTELHGLHHVRFGTLADAVVYSILMQRAPITVAAAMKRKFLARLGQAVDVGGTTLYAMPTVAELADLDADAIAAAIVHRPKSVRIAGALRAVRDIGEPFLRTAPYEQARDALLEIDGIGPFAAAAILLRGLGRMDELPWMPQFARAAEQLYGKQVSEHTVVSRYGRHIGYWSFYVMTGLGRRSRAVH